MDFSQLLFKLFLGARTNFCVRSSLSIIYVSYFIEFRRLSLILLLNPVINKLAVAKPLVINSFSEKLVEVEVVFDEEADVAGFKLQSFIA